jgi:hypothetical protein
MIRRLRFTNFKAWRDSKHIRLAPLTVLFGGQQRGQNEHPAIVAADEGDRPALALILVPRVAPSRFDLAGLTTLLGPSRLTNGPADGIYVRYDTADRLVMRAKLVRPEFVQAIGAHWSRRQLRTNSLADGTAWRGTAGTQQH